MKYENFNEAEKIVKEIRTSESLLDDISKPGYQILVKKANSQKDAIVEFKQGFQNEFEIYCEEMIDRIKTHLTKNVAILKSKLDAL